MSKHFVTVVTFPITPINKNFGAAFRKKLQRNIVTPRLRATEDIWLDYTTEYETQYDGVCYKFDTLEDAVELAEEIAIGIERELQDLINSNEEVLLDSWV
jgi:hypothetical protein